MATKRLRATATIQLEWFEDIDEQQAINILEQKDLKQYELRKNIIDVLSEDLPNEFNHNIEVTLEEVLASE